MIRIVFVITSLSTGGAEMMLFKLLKSIDRKRFEPFVISLVSAGEIGGRIASLGIPVRVLGMGRGRLNLLAIIQLVQEIRKIGPDIVHTWLYHADLLGGVGARLAGVRIVCWGVRSSNLDTDKTILLTRVLRKICAFFSYLIPHQIFLNSEVAKQIHKDIGYSGNKLMVIPNGFDLDLFCPNPSARKRIRSELGFGEDRMVVGMIGRYDPLKNQIGFVSVIKAICLRMPQVHFALAGTGVDNENEELVDALNKESLLYCVSLLGVREDVPDLMAALDVLASPSYAEAFPNVIGEAMASGVPCVATDVGDCAYIIGDTGMVAAKGDMVGFSECLYELLALPREARTLLGGAARARVSSLFELRTVVQRYEHEYLRLVE